MAHLAALTGLINGVAAEGGAQFYVEILAKPGKRTPRPAGEASHSGPDGLDVDDEEGA